jgi:hypothetical protein
MAQEFNDSGFHAADPTTHLSGRPNRLPSRPLSSVVTGAKPRADDFASNNEVFVIV